MKDSLELWHYRLSLDLLLIDHTTNREMVLVDEDGKHKTLDLVQCKPRWMKSKEEKKQRTKKKAEVFTPLWIANRMIDQVDEEFLACSWEDYIQKTWLEICCGEAPFIAQLYDLETGIPVDFQDRKGILDRKLQAIPDTLSREEWKEWGLKALKSVYGYDWQGDSLYLARDNILRAFITHHDRRFHQKLEDEYVSEALEIISWNFFQMDGLTGCIPKTDIPVKIMWWPENRVVLFNDLSRKES